MFSVIFPGQGSQIVGMGKAFFEKHEIVKKLFKEADETLEFSLSKVILEGPKEKLDLTINTQPAIFLISYSIFQVVKQDFNINLNEAKYFAGHSLGEYSALSCAGYLDFKKTIKILRTRGEAMQNSVPKGEGGMLAVLGSNIEYIEKVLRDNGENFKAQIANDNSDSQIVLSGKNIDLKLISTFSTTFIIFLSVTLRPLINFDEIFDFSNSLLILGPPPCTTTIEIPNLFSITKSFIKLLKIFLSIKTFPPYLITIISFLYLLIYFETSLILGPFSGRIFSNSSFFILIFNFLQL